MTTSNRICLRCNHVGPTRESTVGAFGIAVAIFASLIGFSAGTGVAAISLGLLGVSLAAYRIETPRCGVCGSSEIIPPMAPRAQRQTSG